MKLQIFISHSGVCSRRKALELIKSGQVKVNSVIVIEPSCQIDPARDVVHLADKKIFLKDNIYILLNKPKGVTTTKKDRFANRSVMDLLPPRYKHLFPVGRLDKDSTGLLILTNDGELSYKLTHPSFGIEKIYIVKLDKPLYPNHKNQLQKGIYLDGRLTAPCKVINRDKREIKIMIHEGRKRQIKRMFAMLNYRVIDLKRVALGNLSLGNLATGCWRKISNSELLKLKEAQTYGAKRT